MKNIVVEVKPATIQTTHYECDYCGQRWPDIWQCKACEQRCLRKECLHEEYKFNIDTYDNEDDGSPYSMDIEKICKKCGLCIDTATTDNQGKDIFLKIFNFLKEEPDENLLPE